MVSILNKSNFFLQVHGNFWCTGVSRVPKAINGWFVKVIPAAK